MPTSTYIALANYTVPSGGAASVTFSSIPATYRDLVAVLNGTTTATNKDIRISINGNTTDGDYTRVTMSGTGSTTSSITTGTRLITDWGYWTTTEIGVSVVNFMDYSATDKHKTILTRANRAGSGVDAVANRFASTNAITSILFEPSSNSFAEGTTLTLYGIIS